MRNNIRKIILGISIFVGIGFSYSFTNIENSNLKLEDSVGKEKNGCKYGQCYATAKATGRRCKHCVSNEGDLYCWQH